MRYKRIEVRGQGESRRFVIIMDDGVEFEFLGGIALSTAEATQLVADLQAVLS
jgi:hypothetical protein